VAGTYTTRTGKLYKPAAGDDVNVTTDINNNMDNLDTYAMGFTEVATSGSRPTTVWPGLCIFQQDDDTTWVSNGSSPASASWINIPNGSASSTYNYSGAATGTDALTVNVTGDSQKRLIVNSGGLLEWGSGSASVDTNLYRNAANELKTDDSLTVAGSVSVGGTPSLGGGVGVLGIRNAGTDPTTAPTTGIVVYSTGSRPAWINSSANTYYAQGAQAGATVSNLASTAVETTLFSIIVPANEVVNDGIYRLTVMGNLSTSATATSMTLRTKVNGATLLSTGAITANANLTTKPWQLKSIMRFRNPGASANLYSHLECVHRFDGTTAPTAAPYVFDSSNAGSTIDTTSPITFAVTGDWGASSASNSLSVSAYFWERVL
jgi:hypothetical protein